MGVETMASIDALRKESSNPLRILLVDDRIGVRRYTSSNLGKLGHQVLAAASAEEAIELLEQHAFDVALIDVVMPGGADGLFLTSRIHQEYPLLPVVVYSGEELADLKDKAERAGAFDFVQKPFDLMDLNRRLLGAVAEHVRAERGAGSAAKEPKARGAGRKKAKASTGTLRQRTDEVERDQILSALEAVNGNRELAAERLGISDTTLWRKMRRLGIGFKPSCGSS